MLLQLPITSDPAQSFNTQLGTTKYRMDVSYNDRNGVWVLDIYTDTDIPLLLGLALVRGVDLLEPYNNVPGHILVVAGSSLSTDPGPDNLASEFFVLWYDDAELLNG